MTTPASRTHIRRYLYVAVAALAALSTALLWGNYQHKQDIQNLQHSLYNAQVEIRVLQSEKMFGAPFIAPFPMVDQHGQPAALPNFGKGHMLFLFFESWHSPMYLDMMSSFGSLIGDNVPIVGVLQGKSADEITPIVEKFRFRFPVYLAVDSPFDLPPSPHSVLVDGVGNVIHLSPIEYTDTNSAEAHISEISHFLSDDGRPDPAIQPDLAVRPAPAGQPDQVADRLADEKAGIYWPTAVDTKAEVVYNPPIPTDVVDLNFDGVVVTQLVVGTNGNVEKTFVERSSGRAEVDSLMLDVARKMVWTPAVHDGARVKMRVSFPFMFRNFSPSPGKVPVTME